MSARLIIVAAMDTKHGVGKDGGIPWKSPEDMKRFRSLTLGGAVCYGRRTWESLPTLPSNGQKMLADRYNILLTRRYPFSPLMFDHEGSVAPSVREALAIVEAQGLGPLFVIGGRRAWEETFQLAKEGVPSLAYLTEVEGDFKCDTFFPSFMSGWTLIQDGPGLHEPSASIKFQLWSSF